MKEYVAQLRLMTKQVEPRKWLVQAELSGPPGSVPQTFVTTLDHEPTDEEVQKLFREQATKSPDYKSCYDTVCIELSEMRRRYRTLWQSWTVANCLVLILYFILR